MRAFIYKHGNSPGGGPWQKIINWPTHVHAVTDLTAQCNPFDLIIYIYITHVHFMHNKAWHTFMPMLPRGPCLDALYYQDIDSSESDWQIERKKTEDRQMEWIDGAFSYLYVGVMSQREGNTPRKINTPTTNGIKWPGKSRLMNFPGKIEVARMWPS